MKLINQLQKNKPIKQIEQLLLVLPPQSNILLLPEKYRNLPKSQSIIYDLYPSYLKKLLLEIKIGKYTYIT